MIRKALTHMLFGTLLLVASVVAYWVSDRSPPSFHIASWVMSKDLHAGSTISARFIMVMRRMCPQRVEQGIEQGPSGRFPFPARVTEVSEPGLQILTFEEDMPVDIAPGDAVYTATFIWKCPGNLVQGIYPLSMRIEMPIVIEKD